MLINGCSYTKISDLRPNIESRKYSKAVFVNGEIFLFGGRSFDDNFVQTVEKYSITSNKWQSVAELNENRSSYSVCSFMDKVYLIGGRKWFYIDNESESINKIEDNDDFYYNSDDSDNNHSTGSNKDFHATNSCLEFNTKSYKFKDVSCMNIVRCFGHGSTVFEEKVVVAGGVTDDDFVTNTVETYDVFANKWSLMPFLIKNSSDIRLVTVKNKLFAFKEYEKHRCEVFDKTSNEFVALKFPLEYCSPLNEYSTIGSKIFVFPDYLRENGNRRIAHCYDTDKNEWSEVSIEIPQWLSSFNCLKVPSLELFNF